MKKTSNNPLASIIIINFNKSNFLLDSIKSSLKQTYKKKEIIFFDDKSTDDSLKKIKNFRIKNNYDFKIMTNLKKKGSVATINHIAALKKSLSKASGKYVFLMDSDDYFQQNKLNEIIKLFKKNKSYKFILNLPIIKFKKKLIKKKFQYKLSDNKWPKFPPTSCMCFEKKTLEDVIKKISPKKFPTLAIDFRLAVYYSLILKKFIIHNSYLTVYRYVEESMDSKYRSKYRSKKWWIRRKEAFDFLNLILKKNKLPTNKSLDFFVTKIFNKFLTNT
jgi:glycosyltransferase involved in cell wall biosynthesis